MVAQLRWLAAGLILLTAVVYWFSTLTRAGQRIGNGALVAPRDLAAETLLIVADNLSVITGVILAAAGVVVFLLAWWWRGLRSAVIVVLLIAGSVLVAEVLKHVVLPQPALIPPLPGKVDNTLPSGHVTIAMVVSLALVLVVPSRWRGLVAAVGVFFAARIAVSVLAAGWHRPSDALAAATLVTAEILLVVAWSISRGRSRVVSPPGRFRGWTLWLVPLLLGGLGSLGLGLLLVTSQWSVLTGQVPLQDLGLKADGAALYGTILIAVGAIPLLVSVLLIALRRVRVGTFVRHVADNYHVEPEAVRVGI
jgi:membrane-associated phospholipid phosphatase